MVVTVKVTFVAVFVPAGIEDGEKIQVASAGSPEQLKLSGAPMPGLGVKEICSVPDCPAVTVMELSDVEMLNPGLITVTVALA